MTFSLCVRRERHLSLLQIRPPVLLDYGPALTALFNLNYILKLHLQTGTLGVRASTQDLDRTTVQSIVHALSLLDPTSILWASYCEIHFLDEESETFEKLSNQSHARGQVVKMVFESGLLGS